MCDVPWSDTFDGAYCMGNSFGYVDGDAAPHSSNPSPAA
jgi:hypothetical protein